MEYLKRKIGSVIALSLVGMGCLLSLECFSQASTPDHSLIFKFYDHVFDDPPVAGCLASSTFHADLPAEKSESPNAATCMKGANEDGTFLIEMCIDCDNDTERWDVVFPNFVIRFDVLGNLHLHGVGEVTNAPVVYDGLVGAEVDFRAFEDGRSGHDAGRIRVLPAN